MGEKLFSKNEVIFRQGDWGSEFYQVLQGKVRICYDLGEETELILTEVGAGGFFGEMAIIENYPRSATAIALEDGTKLQVIGPEETAGYLEADPEKALMLMEHISDRLRELTKDYNEAGSILAQIKNGEDVTKSGSSAQNLARHRAYGKACYRFENKESEEVRKAWTSSARDNGYSKNVFSYPEGTVLFKEGETGSCMYEIHQGNVGIYKGFGTPKEQLLTTLDINSFFGEMGMITKEPRSATAITLDKKTVIEVIYPEDLKEIFVNNPPKAGMIIGHLSNRLRILTKDYADVCMKLVQS